MSDWSSVETHAPSTRLAAADKLAIVIAYMTEGHLDSDGGYPHAVDDTTIPGWVIVATLDHDGATGLAINRRKTLIAWYDRATAFNRDDPSDFVTCLDETADSVDL